MVGDTAVAHLLFAATARESSIEARHCGVLVAPARYVLLPVANAITGFSSMLTVASRKLTMLDAAQTLEFLKSPPGNRLESLKGDRGGQHSMRTNDQFRLCFRWTSEGPTDVEIVDYH